MNNEVQEALAESMQFDDVRHVLGNAFNTATTYGDAVNLAIVLTECLSAIVSSMRDPTPIQLTVAAAIQLMSPEQAVLAALNAQARSEAAPTHATVH